MKKTKQKNGCMEKMYGNEKTTVCPTKAHAQHRGHDIRAGFTLVELVIVIAIVIILSVISVPIYQGYTYKAKMAEGYALLGTILSAQKSYYTEYGNFLRRQESVGATCYDPMFGIDARGNKYFTWFSVSIDSGVEKKYFAASATKPVELWKTNDTVLALQYNISKGAKIVEWPVNYDGNWWK